MSRYQDQATAQDLELHRIEWDEAAVDAYAEAERLFCKCEALDTCGWSEPGSPAMIWLEQRRHER